MARRRPIPLPPIRAPRKKLITPKPKVRKPIPLPPVPSGGGGGVIPQEPPPYPGGGTNAGQGSGSTASLLPSGVVSAASNPGVPASTGVVDATALGTTDQAFWSTSQSAPVSYSYAPSGLYSTQVAQSTSPSTTQAGATTNPVPGASG